MSLARSWIAWYKNQIDKANDRRGVRFGFHCRRAVSVAANWSSFAGFAELLENVLHARGVGAVILLDPLFDLLGRRNDDVDVFAEREAKIFRRAQIERIDAARRECVFRSAQSAERRCNRARPAGNQAQNLRREFRVR